MEDRTISDIQQKNGVLRERLNRLLNEGDGDRTWNGFEPSKNGASKTKDTDGAGHRYWESLGSTLNEPDKESRQKHFRTLRESVEEIKKREFEFPSTKKTDHVTKEANVREYVPNESFTELELSQIDPMGIKVRDEELVIQQLKEQLKRKDQERKDLIEEFQEKEALMYKKVRQQEAQVKRESQRRENDIRKEYQAKDEKRMLQLERALREKQDHHGKLVSVAETEANLKETIKKISVKLVMYKRQINELSSKNEALRSVNRYITQLQVHQGVAVGLKGVDATVPKTNLNQILTQRNADLHLHFSPEHGIDNVPESSEDDDTRRLIEDNDGTTANLIKGDQSDRGEHDAAVTSKHASQLRKSFFAVLFITRLRRLAENRSRIDQKLQDLALGGSLEL